MDGQFFSFRIGDLIQHAPFPSSRDSLARDDGDSIWIGGDTATQIGHVQASGAEGSALWLSKLSAPTKLCEGSFLQSTDMPGQATPRNAPH